MNEEIRRLLEEYGEEILESEEFQKAYRQKHHKIMTVADHSLGVAIISLRICRLLEKSGFTDIVCCDRLLPENNPGTTWFVIARKEK